MRTKILYLSILILLMNLNYSIAQKNDSCSCCTKDHEAFDFWLGDWTVYNREGQAVGTNKIVRIQNGCVLQENWIATNKTNTGTSYNFYELSDDTWNQVWISNTGNVLRLKGNINASGAMVLKSDLIESSNGILLVILLPRVTSSAYSNSSPTEIPRAIVEIITFES